jgi:tocopherol O-methyltransferase
MKVELLGDARLESVISGSRFRNAISGEPPQYQTLASTTENGRRPEAGVPLNEVASYYDDKTEAIIKRYGPGPRVHYHAGLVDEPQGLDAPIAELRARLIAAQERTLRRASGAWNAPANLSGEVLDVGCGLGGGSIFWAQEFGARVTALTCVPSHADWVARFAGEAGVGSRVFPLIADANELQGRDYFDAAVAVDSSCHLRRHDWFQRLAALLRPGGGVFICDCFLGRSEYAEPFDRYWHTRIGTIDEYLRAADAAGFRAGPIEDLSHRARDFWTLTSAVIEAEAQEDAANESGKRRYQASLREHALLRDGLDSGGLRYALLRFSKERR